MRIGRTLAPAAPPIDWAALWRGAAGLFSDDVTTEDLEEDIRRYFAVDQVWLVASGTSALVLTLRALKARGTRTEVILPAYTCFSVPAAILQAGLRPVPCEIDPVTLDFDYAALEPAVTARTLAVVAHDLFGMPADVDRVRRIVRGRGVTVIEDAAQAMGVEASGRKLGTRGDIGIFSLGRGKPITCGAGGVVITNSRTLAGAIDAEYRALPAPTRSEMWKDWVRTVMLGIFIRPGLYWLPSSVPSLRLGETIFPSEIPMRRLSGVHAVMLQRWQDRLAFDAMTRAAAASALQRRLGLTLPCAPGHPYLRLPVLAASREDRDRLCAEARALGLGLSRAYPTPVNEIPEVRAVNGEQQFPAAKSVSERLLTAPTHHWLSARDVRAVADCIAASRRWARSAPAQRRVSS